MDIVEILRRPERKRLEFERELRACDDAPKRIAASADTSRVPLIIEPTGVWHQVRPAPGPLGSEERLANDSSNRIALPLTPDVPILSWQLTQVLPRQTHPRAGLRRYNRRCGVTRGVCIPVGPAD